MKQTKQDKLRKVGYRVIGTQEFLGLSDMEMELIDLKIALIEKLKQTRAARNLTQQQVAALVGTSQSRIAALERGRGDATLDLICRTLFALGMTRKQIGQTILPRSAA